MALNIRNPEAERLAEALAKLAGKTKTQAVTRALRDRLSRLRREKAGRRLADELDEIAKHCSRLPVRDARTPDEILGYDEHGFRVRRLCAVYWRPLHVGHQRVTSTAPMGSILAARK